MSHVLRGLFTGALVFVCVAAARAQGPPPAPGINFDGIMSLIYDSSSGNMFVENAPLPNPAVQQLSIASASGALIPGNLTLPVLSPPVTVLSATPSLIHVTWAPGNFLGTGSSLGGILAPSLQQPDLLADLTIGYAPASLPIAPGDLIFGTFGTTQGNPVLPNSGGNGFFRFFNVATGQFMDPPLASGYTYTIDSAMSPPTAAFSKVGFPLGLGSSFTVTSSQGVATGIPEGGQHVFPGGVSTFSITGISPAVDAGLPDAFPVYIEFSTPTASFDMQAIPVPEPASLMLAGALGLACVAMRRRAFA